MASTSEATTRGKDESVEGVRDAEQCAVTFVSGTGLATESTKKTFGMLKCSLCVSAPSSKCPLALYKELDDKIVIGYVVDFLLCAPAVATT